MSKTVNLAITFNWLFIATRCDWLKNSRANILTHHAEVKIKLIVTCLHAFGRAWSQLHVLAWNSDWFFEMTVSVVFHHNDSLGFDRTMLN